MLAHCSPAFAIRKPIGQAVRWAFTLSALWSIWAAAADFRALGYAAPARVAPNETAPVAFYYGKGTPVEVIQEIDGWAQVRDKEGEGLYWVPRAALSTQRTIITVHPETEVRSAPDPQAALVMVLPENAVVPLTSTVPPGWVEVVTPNGPGFIAKRDVWGW